MRFAPLAMLAVTAVALAAMPSSLRAQEADAEDEADVQIVEAMIFRSDGSEPSVLAAEIAGSGDEMTAALTVPSAPGFRMEMDNFSVGEGGMTFSFLEPGGTTIGCELIRLEDDSFRGDCDAAGVPLEMSIEAFEE
jgi:hypothetical protein